MPLIEYEPGRCKAVSCGAGGAWAMTDVAWDTGDSVPGSPCFAFSAALFLTILRVEAAVSGVWYSDSSSNSMGLIGCKFLSGCGVDVVLVMLYKE